MKKIVINFLWYLYYCIILALFIPAYLIGFYILSYLYNNHLIITIILILSSIKLLIIYKEIKHTKELKRREDEEKKKYDEWINNIEPKLRYVKGYPEDWGERRDEVYKLAGGICTSCGQDVLEYAHVHHIIPISQGGSHSFSNLELLCEDCHIEEHPNNAGLRMSRNWRKLYIGRNAKIKHARRAWKCALCENEIKAGESYYGGSYHKICLRCYNAKYI